MKSYTVRFAHLQELPIPKLGDVIFPGDKVGRMGTTGQSKFPHLHIDVVEGLQDKIIRLQTSRSDDFLFFAKSLAYSVVR